ncbi:MAG: tyrosine-type recombinase/integrase [Deltaproteobacteria bacterium]|nr:tyrosine-type recombinase/integrase [Deltaproteobacteria bacterium]
MILFKSFMALQLEEYIAYRKSLGYTDKSLRSQLRSFDRYLVEKSVDQTSLVPRFFLDLRKELKGEPRTVNGTLSALRGLFQYLIRKGICKENPLLDIPLRTENAYIPFVFSLDQIEQLLLTIQKRIRKNRKHFFKDLTAYVGIVLMARCGMRISEPLRLRLEHYRSREGTLYIEKTKFSKDRLVPVPKPAINEINNYLAVRNTFIKDQNPYLLAEQNGNRLSNNRIYPVFHQAVKDIGIDQPRRIIANTTFGAPTCHSLRHSFAINTLKQIKDQGKSPQYALPILSVYMGHRKYQYTAVYLKVLDAKHRQGLVDFAISMQDKI